jgi:hypothetical protein
MGVIVSGNSYNEKGISGPRPLGVVSERYKGIVPEALRKTLSVHHRE